jgi:hypothetical protein
MVRNIQHNIEGRETLDVGVLQAKLDILFGIILVLLGIFFFLDTLEIVVSVIGILVAFGMQISGWNINTAGWALLGNTGVRLEDHRIMVAFYILSPIEPVELIVKVAQFYASSQKFETVPVGQITAVCKYGFCQVVCMTLTPDRLCCIDHSGCSIDMLREVASRNWKWTSEERLVK